jgi:hypothetical protein
MRNRTAKKRKTAAEIISAWKIELQISLILSCQNRNKISLRYVYRLFHNGLELRCVGTDQEGQYNFSI